MSVQSVICRVGLLLVLTLVFPLFAAGQGDFTPYADRWNGLIPGQSTINDAKKIMGRKPIEIVRAASDSRPETLEQQWVFKYPFKRVKLEFVNGTLTSITLATPTQPITADEVPRIISARFSAKFDEKKILQTAPANFSESAFVGEANFPVAYFLVANTASTVVVCSISNKPIEHPASAPPAGQYLKYPGLVNSITIAVKGWSDKETQGLFDSQ